MKKQFENFGHCNAHPLNRASEYSEVLKQQQACLNEESTSILNSSRRMCLEDIFSVAKQLNHKAVVGNFCKVNEGVINSSILVPALA